MENLIKSVHEYIVPPPPPPNVFQKGIEYISQHPELFYKGLPIIIIGWYAMPIIILGIQLAPWIYVGYQAAQQNALIAEPINNIFMYVKAFF